MAARTLLASGHSDFAASRSYYAAFYAATAALLNEGLEYGKHSGVISAVHRKFIKSGRLDETLGKSLNWLLELRNVGDYGETQHVSSDEASRAIDAAKAFVQAIGEMLSPG